MVDKIKVGDTCQYGSCRNDAESLVYSREDELVLKCCYYHAEIVQDQGSPEYVDTCMNCGCTQGVN